MPLLGGGVDLSVELSHADGLGIQDDLLHVLEAVVLAFLLAKGDHSVYILIRFINIYLTNLYN